ncbi:ATP-binding response regulator [Anaeromyxobacter paludicola]|uniref:histidine kinase n=1 Tax=Anaeromyxobacter paludicola TaxID=2918171 RepID=A0ABN6NB92_9BACT|nr:ATP-binding protein [Anaeromyxobacter paludicola]BDG10504.1 hypothetical protein AMPC_36170 [Anaeromyxobacter paludicola]
MVELFRRLFLSEEYMPHGHCYLWQPGLVSLHVVSDALIGTAYLAISVILYQLVRHIRLPFSPMILAFGVFIGACGLTHYMEVLTLWFPDYWLSGGVKAVTAVASVATGVYLFRVRPTILSVTRGAQLAEERRVRLESTHRELERLYERVKDLDDAKTRFFANVSHELRTPLALVLGPVEKLLAGPLEERERRELEVVRRNGRLLLRHVNDMLDLARLDEGRLTLDYARVDLAERLRGLASAFEGVARDRGVRLEVEAGAPVPVEADAPKLDRVALNLLGNAFKFAPPASAVRCAVRAEGDRAVLEVEDQGPGVPPELREAIFERFRQGRGAPEGAGLGLAISRELVVLHGGTIGVGDGARGGARFTVAVPLRAPAGAPVAAAPPPLGLEAARATADLPPGAARELPALPVDPSAPLVLLVEDNAEMGRFAAAALAAEFRVATASEGAEGLRKAEALEPDLVVTDLMMPGLPGDALVSALRRLPALGRTPVMVLTARADERQRLALLRDGAQDYLVKPFHPEELLARARNLVAMKRSSDVLRAELAQRSGDLEALAREVARRKRELEVALETAQVAREQAERASQVKSVFLGMVSHELRTPITSMLLTLQSLQRQGAAPPEARARAMQRIEQAARRLLELIESLLEYTRVESGRLVVRPERVDLARLAREVADELLPQAQARLLKLEVEAAPLPPLEADPRLLRLVLINLVVNAIKYTERGGVRITAGEDGDRQWVAVADTGPGIPPEARDRIFEPFEQVGALENKHQPGVGIGLSLVRGIAAAIGGRVELVESGPAGTVFRVAVPLRPALKEPEPAPGAPAPR